VVLRVDGQELDDPTLNFLPHNVIVNFYVLYALMKHLIGCYLQGRLVVAK